jgi:DNA repair photolyase
MSSIITYDPKIAERLEARTPTPQRRMEVLKTLTDL